MCSTPTNVVYNDCHKEWIKKIQYGHSWVTGVIGVSRLPVVDCGTTFHLDYGSRDLPLTPSDNH